MVVKMMQDRGQSPDKLLDTQKLSVDASLSLTGEDFSSALMINNSKRAGKDVPLDGNSPFS